MSVPLCRDVKAKILLILKTQAKWRYSHHIGVCTYDIRTHFHFVAYCDNLKCPQWPLFWCHNGYLFLCNSKGALVSQEGTARWLEQSLCICWSCWKFLYRRSGAGHLDIPKRMQYPWTGTALWKYSFFLFGLILVCQLVVLGWLVILEDGGIFY